MSNNPTKLMRLLNLLYQQQARDVLSKVRPGDPPPDTSGWVRATADAVKPLLLEMWQQGMVQASARIAAKLGKRAEADMPRVPAPSMDGMRRHQPGNESIFGPRMEQRSAPMLTLVRKRLVCKASGQRKTEDLGFSFDLFNPKVLDAVDAAAYAFCRETNETATRELGDALDDLRRLMREGLPQGDAVALLAKKVRMIFADPMRAFRIAATEGSRAVHGGQMMAAVEAGVKRHSWLASADACEQCLSLDGKTVNIGEPFHVDQKGGPYAVILYPPAHPFLLLHDSRGN